MAKSQGLLDFWPWLGNFYSIQLHSGIHWNHLWIKPVMTTAPMILMTIQFYIFDGSFELCQLVGIDGILWMFFHAACEERSRHAMLSGSICTLINFSQTDTMIFVLLFHEIQKWWKEEGPLSRGPKMRFGQPWEVILWRVDLENDESVRVPLVNW